MLKTYHSSSELSINVRVGDGTLHLSFVPLTLGGSTFTTSDAGMQRAIESHRFFGTRIRLVAVEKEENIGGQHLTEGKRCDEKKKTLHFSSIVDAKEYCADTFGVSRTMLRNSMQIRQLAAEKGYVIEIDSPKSYDT